MLTRNNSRRFAPLIALSGQLGRMRAAEIARTIALLSASLILFGLARYAEAQPAPGAASGNPATVAYLDTSRR